MHTLIKISMTKEYHNFSLYLFTEYVSHWITYIQFLNHIGGRKRSESFHDQLMRSIKNLQ